MIAVRRVLVLSCALSVVSTTARAADVCGEVWEAASGPLPGGIGPADFGAIPEACAASEVALRLRGALLVASSKPDFYGSIIAGAMVRARRRIDPRSWLSIAFDAIDYRYINNGGLASTGASFGPLTIALYRTLFATVTSTTALYGRALLPLDTARQSGVETGLELGGSTRARVGARTTVDGGLALTAPLDLISGRAYGRLEPVVLAEAWYAPRPAIAVAAGASVKAEVAPTPTFITAVPRVAGRFALRHRVWLAVLVEVPVAGTDRTDLVASLFAGYSP